MTIFDKAAAGMGGRLTYDQWVEEVEERRQAINPHLDSFTLHTLAQAEFLPCFSNWNTIFGYQSAGLITEMCPAQADQIQGIFGYRIESHQLVEVHGPGDGSCLYLWGLSRKGKWLLVKISLLHEGGQEVMGLGLISVKVDVEEVVLKDMLALAKVSPVEVCFRLGNETLHWVERTRVAYESSRRIGLDFQAADRLYTRLSETYRGLKVCSRAPLII